jgi:hypothetical protein
LLVSFPIFLLFNLDTHRMPHFLPAFGLSDLRPSTRNQILSDKSSSRALDLNLADYIIDHITLFRLRRRRKVVGDVLVYETAKS